MSRTIATSSPTAAPGRPAGRRLTRRRRRQLTLSAQWLLLVAIAVLLLWKADWSSLRTNFAKGDVARSMFPEVVSTALLNTILYTACAFVFGFLLGLVLALMRLSSVAPYRWLAALYVEIFRGLPALLIFIFVGVGLPIAFPGFTVPGGTTGKVALALGLVSAAYMAETFRAGIQAVPRGQVEAARTLGMSSATAMRSVVVPQALRIVIPPLTNELVLLLKDSSLVLFLGVAVPDYELSKFANDLAGNGNSTPLIVSGLFYLALTVPLGYLARRLEARGQRGR